MGIYTRPDSKYWWMHVEGTPVRGSTGVPVRAGSPAQDREQKHKAEAIYARRKTEAAQMAAGLIAVKPVVAYKVFAQWFETHELAHHRGADKEISILRQLGTYFDRFDSLQQIDAPAVKEWMTWRRRAVQPGTVNRELDVLKRLIAAAVPKYLDASPIAGLRRFRTEEHEPRVLTIEEEARLLAVADAEDSAWLVMAIDTLMRLSNVVHLKWAQVKFPQQTIVPLNAKVKHDVVPMTARIKAALEILPRDTDLVFPRFHRGRTAKTAAKNHAIRRFDLLCQLAGIPHGRAADGVTFHCLRHTGATRALQHGASVRTVMKLGGWRDERSVMRYVHAADMDVRAAAESIGQFTPPSRESGKSAESA
jgi:integrase